VYAVMTSWCPR